MLRITKETRDYIQEPALFLRGYFDKELYYKYKGKGYAMEVVITAKKLSLNSFKGQLRQSTESAGQQSRD